jgi:DNA-binding response OmpR family regulator
MVMESSVFFRKNESFFSVPFIFLSAKLNWAISVVAWCLVRDDYNTKPFDDVELLDTIEMRLRKHKSNISSTAASSIKNQLSGQQVIDSLPASLKEAEPRSVRKRICSILKDKSAAMYTSSIPEKQ